MNKLNVIFFISSIGVVLSASEEMEYKNNFKEMQRNGLLQEGYSQEDVDNWRWERNGRILSAISSITFDGQDLTSDGQDLTSRVIFCIPLHECEQLYKLRERVDQKFEQSGKFFFPREEVSPFLQNVLQDHPKGIRIVFNNGQKVVIRSNLSRKYILYLIHDDVNYFTLH